MLQLYINAKKYAQLIQRNGFLSVNIKGVPRS